MIDTAGRRPCALVTGAGSGLGRAIAVQLADHGWHIVLTDINPGGCAETAALVEAAGGTARCEQLDVAEPQQWLDLVDRLQRDMPRLDLLVNNAGVAVTGEIGVCEIDNWHWLLSVNLFGVIHGCHACRDWLVRSPGSHVVNIASAAAFAALPNLGAYNVSKAGVLCLSETLYAELRPHGVGVTVACPGFFASNILREARFDDPGKRAEGETYVQRSMLSADQVARAILLSVRRRKLYAVVPAGMSFFWWLRRLFPTDMMNAASRAYARKLRAQRVDSANGSRVEQTASSGVG
jgi:NAD(P)-dependent dehydrogenase (short-subunit alcohol dehydrogenase family)